MRFSRIVAFDLSLTGTGWAEYNVSSLQLQWDLCPACEARDQQRMHHILKFVRSKVDTDSLVIIEDFSFGSKGSSIYEIAGLGHLVRYWLWQNSIIFILVAPSELKKFVTGSGNAAKELVIKEIFKRFGKDVSNNNLADAIGLNFIGQTLLDHFTPQNEAQRKIRNQLWAKNKTKLAVAA